MLFCVILNKVSIKMGLPSLILFLIFGMAFNNPIIFNIDFQNFEVAEYASSICLLFIMFYGGFGTRWTVAKEVMKPSVLLSTIGVVITATLVAAFCIFALKFSVIESFLIGSIVSSTDAASVFSIIRSKKLSLKYNTSSLLELESGSNDPMAYMLTIVSCGIILGTTNVGSVFQMLVKQVILGVFLGYLFYKVILYCLTRVKIDKSLGTVLIFSALILLYSLSSIWQANGYLAVYVFGVCLGNSNIKNKAYLVHFFDGITLIMQILLFFLLGLLSTPALILKWLPISVVIFLFLTFIARVITVDLLMRLFGMTLNQKLVISAAGFRGAASIVFAIMAKNMTGNALSVDVFHITFGIVLLSILIQGSFFSRLTKKLDIADQSNNYLRTFSDYLQERSIEFIRISISKGHSWIDKKVKQLNFNAQMLIVLILRNGEKIIPSGDLLLKENDELVCIAKTFHEQISIDINEVWIDSDSEYLNKNMRELPDNMLVMLILRGNQFIIPSASEKLLLYDRMIYLYK